MSKPWEKHGINVLTWMKLYDLLSTYGDEFHSLPVANKFSRTAIRAVRTYIRKEREDEQG